MTEDLHPKNPAETVRDLMTELGDVRIVDIEALDSYSVDAAEHPILLSVPKGRELVDASKFFDARRDRPRRMKGTMRARTLQSLVDWTDRFKGDNSVLFLDRSDSVGGPAITAIANYHHGLPEFCDHRAVYGFPLSDEWRTWTKANGNAMEVPEFGEFLEDNAKDLLNPTPAMLGHGTPESNWETRAIETAALLGGRFGDVAQMLALGRDFRVRVDDRAAVKFDRATGQSNIAFSQDHTDDTGEPLRLPSLFMIRIPVFDRGAIYPLLVRFLYRARGGVKLFFEIYDPATALNDAIDEAAEVARTQTGLPMFEGTPEDLIGA